jgi:hypothetical protein
MRTSSTVIEFMTESGVALVPCNSLISAKEEALSLEATGELPGYGKIISFFIDDRNNDRGQIR